MIPARYQSVRFPGKPLVSILGKPMVVRTWEQASKATTLQKVVVATDDERIASACRDAGAEVVMTSSECPNGETLQEDTCKILHAVLEGTSGKRLDSDGGERWTQVQCGVMRR